MIKTMITPESAFLLLILIGSVISCNRDVSNIAGAPFTYQDEYFEGNDSYPFPDGVYAKYKVNSSTYRHYNADSILIATYYTGISILEAWDIVGLFGPNVYPAPNLILRLKDRFQPIDTLKFSYVEKPGLGYKAKIRHYIFY